MKIIFSRKGADSAAGRCASPLVDGRPISIPIPTRQPTATCYGDLADPIPRMIADLTRGRLSPDKPCHLDPDIGLHALNRPRPKNWRGAFGQISAALSHLRNANIGPNDLFLFWGLYQTCRNTGDGWRFTGLKRHGIFGWLQVDRILDLGPDGSHALNQYPWLFQHPHVRPNWTNQNAIFIAKERLNFGENIRGYGTFNQMIPLTWEGSKLPSTWDIPAWLDPTAGGVSMTYHPPQRWLGAGRLAAAPRGQEFVADIGNRQDAHDWLHALFRVQETRNARSLPNFQEISHRSEHQL